jgi:tRNA pseudouridine synthase 10
VRGLHHADKSRVRFLKETPHSKEYGVLVALEGPVDDARLAALVGPRRAIVQQTPARVAHRRADKARERWIEITSVERRSELVVHVVMRTEHGTYVKEAVNGEGGATRRALPLRGARRAGDPRLRRAGARRQAARGTVRRGIVKSTAS